jgi:hypothetical protein
VPLSDAVKGEKGSDEELFFGFGYARGRGQRGGRTRCRRRPSVARFGRVFRGILPVLIQGRFCHLQGLNDEGGNLAGKWRDGEAFWNQLVAAGQRCWLVRFGPGLVDRLLSQCWSSCWQGPNRRRGQSLRRSSIGNLQCPSLVYLDCGAGFFCVSVLPVRWPSSAFWFSRSLLRPSLAFWLSRSRCWPSFSVGRSLFVRDSLKEIVLFPGCDSSFRLFVLGAGLSRRDGCSKWCRCSGWC